LSRSAARLRFDSGAARRACVVVRTIRIAFAVVVATIVAVASGCARRTAGPSPSNDLLIVGYDREPDTLNRFSTHILEDIQTCVVEGLTTTDERMQVVPLLARGAPDGEDGGGRRRAA